MSKLSLPERAAPSTGGALTFGLVDFPYLSMNLNLYPSLSPPGFIHTGCGSAAYAFSWGMAGENPENTDLDQVALADLR